MLDEYAQGDALMFAILETNAGFCGSVSLTLHRGVGFISYWLGEEFRGYGLASEAVRCLLNMAGKLWGLRCCYAQVYEFNGPSRRLLSRLGFVRQPVIPEAPHEDKRFYRLGGELTEQEAVEELRTLLADMESNVVIRARLLACW